QSPPLAPSHQPSMQELLDRIDRLEKRVDELEANERKPVTTQVAGPVQPAMAPLQSAQAGTPPTSQEHEQMVSKVEMQEAEPHYPSLQIHGFGDVDFSSTDQKGSN